MARYLVQMRRGTAEQWAKSPIIPLAGEIVVELDEINNLHKLKIGDGVHTYAELAYLMAGDEVVTQVLPRVVTVPLIQSKWKLIENTDDPKNGCYEQEVALEAITKYSQLDLHPAADMLAEFKNLGLVFVTENHNGVITVYSIGNVPLKDYDVQATIVETEVIAECDKIVGATVGTPIATMPHTTDDIEAGTEDIWVFDCGDSGFRVSENEAGGSTISFTSSSTMVACDENEANGQTAIIN